MFAKFCASTIFIFLQKNRGKHKGAEVWLQCCSSIDGEWPSTVLKFSKCIEYRVKPPFFAYQDCEQIPKLFLKFLFWLWLCYNDQNIYPRTLWEKTTALMVIAATKKPGIEVTVSPIWVFTWTHHILCRRYTMEAIDKSSL